MKITIELNEPIKDLDGKPMVPDGLTVGKVLGNVLVNQPEGNAVKFYEWAMSWHKGQIVEVDTSDWDLIYKFVENNKTLNVLAKYPILMALSDAKDKSKGT